MTVRSRARRARSRVDALLSSRSQSPQSPDGRTDAASALERMLLRDRSDVENMRRLLAFVLRADSCCVDVGAHRGAVLKEMVRVAPRGRHIAVEPLPHLAAHLRESFPEVEVHECALSDHAGESTFAYVHGSAEGWSGLRFRPLPGGASAEVEDLTVRLAVLDELLEPGYRPAVIKIDVEGAEQQVLAGALETLHTHQPVIIFEHGSGSSETYGTYPSDIHALLSDDAGYRIFDLDGNGPYALPDFERSFYTGERVNFVAHP